MRVCVFSPDTSAFADGRWRDIVRGIVADPSAEFVLLTNSWAKPPEGVRVTAGARNRAMRLCRKWLATAGEWPGGAAAGALLVTLNASNLLEVLFAADPDVLVCLDPRWAGPLKWLVGRAHPAWRCLTLGERCNGVDRRWRRYDTDTSVSIVLPTYSGAAYLRQSIESCLSQTFPHIQLVVVDDGSPYPIESIVNEYPDSRLLYVRHPRNLGLPEALNTGFRRATGKYLSWTSDDNYYAPTAIEEMLRFLQTYPKVDFVYAESYAIGAPPRWYAEFVPAQPPEWLAVGNGIGACFLYKRRVYETIGDFDPRAVLAEDYDYWLRVATRFRMQRVFKRLYYYRFHPESLTSRHTRDEIREKVNSVKRARLPRLKRTSAR